MIFQGNTINRLNKMMDKSEARKEKLAKQVEDLKEEKEQMRQAVEDDLQGSILLDKEPNKKLSKDFKAVQEDLENAQLQLSQIDSVVQNEFIKAKEDVLKEINDFRKEAQEKEFDPIKDELNQLKYQYLLKLIEYHKKESEYSTRFYKTFQDIIRRVGIPHNFRTNPRDHFGLSLNMRHQRDGHYSPMITLEELRKAVYGEMPILTDQNKDKYKKG